MGLAEEDNETIVTACYEDNIDMVCSLTCGTCSVAPSSLPSSLPSPLQSSLPSSLQSSLPSSLASSLPSSLPSVIPSSLPSVYVCKDVTDEVAFTRKNKDWSCIKLGFQYDKKIKKICKDIVDAQRQCAITCNSCPTSLPSVMPSSSPSASVIPSSLPSVYVCKDVTDKVAFTKNNNGWSCKKLRRQKDKKIKKICKKTFDAQRQCAITCNSCFSNSPSLATLSPSDVCKDAGDEYTFNYKSEEYTCKILQGESVGKIEKVCWKKQLAQKYCPLTCDVCTPVIIK